MGWYGYRGRILRVDLSARTITTEALERGDLRSFVGGAGLNAWLLYQGVQPSLSPLDPSNPLIFGAGPLVGTGFPSSSRSTFTTLSPLTGIFGDANGGGFFGGAVKRAGFDHIVVLGASETPCCLVLRGDGEATLEDARALWGRDTLETHQMLQRAYPGGAAACIGPAGEQQVRYASIVTNSTANSWARTGVGAVMGSKKLKAIVALGTDPVPVADPRGFSVLSRKVNEWAATSPSGRLFSKVGTTIHVGLLPALGYSFKQNGRLPVSVSEASRIDWTAFQQQTETRAHGCHSCALKCGKRYRVKAGEHAGEEGYRYDATYAHALGFNLGITDLGTLLHLGDLSNRLGFDIIEFSGSVGLAIDLFRQGVLDRGDTDGLELDWGAGRSIAILAGRVARREGFGAVLAEGSKRAAAAIGRGAETYSQHSKGMSETAPSSPALVLGYAVSPRGGDHMKAGIPILNMNRRNVDLSRQLFGGTSAGADPSSHVDKGRVVWWHENYKMATDCLGICFYLTSTLLPTHKMLPEDLAEAYRVTTGLDMDGEALLGAGERGVQVEKALNARLGIGRADDAFTTRPERSAWSNDVDLDHPGMLDEYYDYRGCSPDGLPTRLRLGALGLGAIADDLEREGRLGAVPCPPGPRSIQPVRVAAPVQSSERQGSQPRGRNRSFGLLLLSLPGGVGLFSSRSVLRPVMHMIAVREKLSRWLRRDRGGAPKVPDAAVAVDGVVD